MIFHKYWNVIILYACHIFENTSARMFAHILTYDAPCMCVYACFCMNSEHTHTHIVQIQEHNRNPNTDIFIVECHEFAFMNKLLFAQTPSSIILLTVNIFVSHSSSTSLALRTSPLPGLFRRGYYDIPISNSGSLCISDSESIQFISI